MNEKSRFLKAEDIKPYRHSSASSLKPVENKTTKRDIAVTMTRISNRLASYRNVQSGVVDGAQAQYSHIVFK